MRLMDILRESLIKIGLEARNKWDAIEELVDYLITEHEIKITDREAVLRAVVAREKSLSTGMQHGVAIPHGTVDCIREVIACLGISPDGIDFESLDGKPTHFLMLLIIPKNTFQSHVKTLAGIARLMNSEALRDQLRRAESGDQAFAIIEREESRDLFWES